MQHHFMLTDVSDPGGTVRNSVLFVRVSLATGDGSPAARKSPSSPTVGLSERPRARSLDSATGTVSGAMKAEYACMTFLTLLHLFLAAMFTLTSPAESAAFSLETAAFAAATASFFSSIAAAAASSSVIPGNISSGSCLAMKPTGGEWAVCIVIGFCALPVGFIARQLPLDIFPGMTDEEAAAAAMEEKK